MSKLVLFLSLLGVAILLTFGIADPSSPVVWLASTSHNFVYLRVGMIITLLALLVTNPPRNVYLRTVVGAAALIMVSWSLSATYNNQMKFLDTLSILEVSISAGLVVLERNYEEVVEKVQKSAAKKKSAKKPRAKLATA